MGAYLVSETFTYLLVVFYSCHCPIPVSGSQIFNFLTDPCGQVSSEIHDETSAVIPWTAGIFARNDQSPQSGFEFLHTGAIVRSNVIFTVLKTSRDRSVFTLEDNKWLNISRLFVAAGIQGTDLKNFEGLPQTQISEVDSAIAYEHSPVNLNYQLVLLHLKNPLDLRGPFVRSICLPLTYFLPSLLKDPVDSGFFYSPGFAWSSEQEWGKSHRLHAQILERGTPSECKQRFNELYEGNFEQLDCGWKPGHIVEDGACLSRGSIDSIETGGKYFLKGLAVLEKTCTINSTIFFFNLLNNDVKLQNWMVNTIKCMSINNFGCGSGECINTEQVCNHKSDCRDASGLDEDTKLCSRLNPCVKNEFYCGGFGSNCISKDLVCDGKNDCRNGADELPSVCPGEPPVKSLNNTNNGILLSDRKRKLGRKCDVLQYPIGVALSCTNENIEVDCQNARQGTKLKLRCKSFYIASNKISHHEMICSENGTWTPFRQFACKADCGKIDTSSINHQTSFISNGMQTTIKYAFPWYAALFTWNIGKKTFEYSCGASLIENSVMISAAHCVTNHRGQVVDANSLRVVLAPTSSVFMDNSEKLGSKILKVNGIWIPPTFDPYTISSDIAIIRLNQTAEYTQYIQPICYLTTLQSAQQPSVGAVGLVAGFGKDESGLVSENLKWASFPVISSESCSDYLGVKVKMTALCAGYQNDTAVCEGDSGSGFILKKYNTKGTGSPYVLKGIVSKALASENGNCITSGVGVFTNVDTFGAWILETLENIDLF